MRQPQIPIDEWRRHLRSLVIVAFALGSSGCGFLFVSGPPPEAANSAYVPCTDSKVLPTLDAVMAGLQVVNIALVASMDELEFEDNFGGTSKGAIMAIQGGFGLLWGFSARSGYSKVSECRAARAAAAASDQAAALRSVRHDRSSDGSDWRPPMLPPSRVGPTRPAGGAR